MNFIKAIAFAGALAATSGATAAYAQEAAANPVTAIRAGKLFDSKSRTLKANQVILVQGDKITAVGPASSVRIPAGAKVIDLSKSTVTPGLIDTHMHIFSRGRGTVKPEEGDLYRVAVASMNAEDNLMAGITSVVDLGSHVAGRSILELRDAINEGNTLGPRIQAAGRGIKARDRAIDGSFIPDTPEEARMAVREIKRGGYDWVKVYNGSTFEFKDGKSIHGNVISLPIMEAISDEARKHGLRTACHAYGGEALANCVKAGFTAPQHGIDLDETPDTLKLIKDNNSSITATILELELQAHEDEEKFAGDSRWKHAEKAWKAAYKAGITLPFGSGAGPFPHGTQTRGLKFFTDWGGKPGDVLAGPTILSAEKMGWGDRAGSIEVGKWADIIAVPGDPFVDMAVMQNVGFVMKGGVIFKDKLSASASTVAAR